MKTISNFFAFFCCVTTIVLLFQGLYGQSSDASLMNKKIDLQLSNTTVLEVVSALAVRHRIPIGLEWAVDSRERMNRKIQINGGTLKEILDSMTLQEPQYRWEIRDDVINISPVVLRDVFLEKLLRTKINKFLPEKGSDKFQMRDTLIDLPEVKKLSDANHVKILYRTYSNVRSIYADDNVDLSISNVDVRTVLNKVILESEHKLWVVERIGKEREYLLVSF